MKKRVVQIPVCFIMLIALVSVCVSGFHINTQAASKGNKIIAKKSKITLTPGNKFQIKLKSTKASKSVIYKSNNKKVATVSKRGVVKAKKAGKTKIVIASKKKKSIKTTVTVTVRENTKKNEKPADSKNEPTPPKQPSEQAEVSGFDSLPEMYLDIILNKFSMMADTSTVNWIAVNMEDSKNLSASDKQTLTGLISKKYGKETMQKTRDELKDEGRIVYNTMYGFVIQGGVLIGISETEKDSSGFSFGISCSVTGLYGRGFSGCKAVMKNNKWTYTLGAESRS